MRSCGIINEAISGAAEKKKHVCAPDPSEDKYGRGEFRALKRFLHLVVSSVQTSAKKVCPQSKIGGATKEKGNVHVCKIEAL